MTGAQVELLEATAQGWSVPLARDAIRRLDAFLTLLNVWNQRTRLVGDRDPDIIVAKHVLDSLAAIQVLPTQGLVVDLGSGGGLPGAVIGCVRLELRLAFVESRRRPASFLREVARIVPLTGAEVVEERGEDAARDPMRAGRADAVISRAVRPDVFLPIAAKLVTPDGVVVAMQTPASAGATREVGRGCGLDPFEDRAYELPSGERRMLVLFRR